MKKPFFMFAAVLLTVFTGGIAAQTYSPIEKGLEIVVVVNGMIHLKSGTFSMGDRDNGPAHQVTVSAFWIGQDEVTQQEYQALMGTNPSNFKGDHLPVENVSWYDAVNYCNALSRAQGLTPAYTVNGNNVTWNRNASGYRLPTEAEWEYACRARTTTAYSFGDAISSTDANYDSKATTPVGTYAPNPWGLEDMHGNVWEWVWDWYGSYSSGAQTDPAGASSGTRRVLRGGSWNNDGRYLCSANRFGGTPAYRNSGIGFRLVRSHI